MKTTQKERDKAREGCHFFHNGMCLCDVKGKTWCSCLIVLRDKKKQINKP